MARGTLTCKESVWRPDIWRSAPCKRPASKDGFCSAHHPDAVAARKGAREAAYEAERRAAQRAEAERAERNRRAEAYPRVVAALRSLLDVMNDRNAPGTNVDGRWMGVPDWDSVDAATALLRELEG